MNTMKLIDRVKNTFRYTQTLSKTHPFTFAALVAATFCGFMMALCDGFLSGISWIRSNENTVNEVWIHLIVWLIMALFATFLLENLVEKDNLGIKLAVTVPVAIVTFIYAGALTESCIFRVLCRNIKSAVGESHLIMYAAGYFIILFLISVFLCFRKLEEKYSFGEYIMGLISGGFLISVVYSVVNIGLIVLTFVFTELLFGDFEDIFPPLAVLVTGLYLGGAAIVTVTESLEDIPKFTNVLFRYVLYGMSLAAYVIVYLYIIKILVLQDFPSNSVFGILTALFCFSIPLAYLNIDKTIGVFEIISRILPYVFAPLIILQIYTVVVRIRQYGLTESRYLGMVFIAFEIAYIVWYALRRDTIKYIPLVMAALVCLLTFIPGSNMLSLPKITQTLTLNRYLKYDTGDLTSTARRRMYSAYDYLRGMDNGNAYLKKHYSDSQLEFIKENTSSGTGNDDYYDSVDYRRFSCEIMELSVDGYESITAFENRRYVDESASMNSIPIYRRSIGYYGNEERSFDIFDAEELIRIMTADDYENTYDSDAAEPLVFDQGGKHFIITEATVSYDTITGEIIGVDVTGLLLRK